MMSRASTGIAALANDPVLDSNGGKAPERAALRLVLSRLLRGLALLANTPRGWL